MHATTYSPEFLSSIINHAPYGFITTDFDGKVLLANQQALDHFQMSGSPSDYLGMDSRDFFPIKDSVIQGELLDFLYKNQGSFNFEDVHISERLLNIRGRKFPKGMIITTFDVTKTLLSRNNDTLVLIKGEEQERRKLYKEIHDGVGSLISTLQLKLDSVKSELADVQEKTIVKINAMRELMQTATQDIRSISQTLIPSSIIDFGLAVTLSDICKTATLNGFINANFYQSGIESRLGFNLELGLFRIAQELFSNTLAHAKAENIFIQVIRHETYISLVVEDDGVGFDKNNLEEILQKGIGLRNIKTRTKSFNGSFHIETRPNRGLMVTVEIPIEK